MNTIIKILVTGPESTGKSEITDFLSSEFRVPAVQEFAREYLNTINREYQRSDLDEILKGQITNENKALSKARNNNSPFIICDTGPEVLYIWSMFKFGSVSEAITRAVKTRTYDFALLPDIDLPWEDDPQRETPKIEDRKRLLKQYRTLLAENKTPYEIISGTGEIRLQRAKRSVEKRINELR